MQAVRLRSQKRSNAVVEMSIATVQKEIGELQHKVDEEEASRNVGNDPQEREESIRIKSVASTTAINTSITFVPDTDWFPLLDNFSHLEDPKSQGTMADFRLK